jgi:cytochrome c oxidase assembly factor CtaG
MNDRRKSWGVIRWIYLVAGIIAGIGAAFSFISPGSISPFLASVIALLVLAVPLLASDELLQRVHRIFWRREWPK